MNPSRLPPKRGPQASRLFWAAAPLLALAVGPPSLNAQQTRTVNIEAVCAGDNALASVSIDPWTLYVPAPSTDTNRNVQIEWVLQNSSPDSIAVHAKDEGNWPFGFGELRGNGQGRNRAPKAKMLGRIPKRGGNGTPRRVQRGERFQYFVIFYCTAADGTQYTVSVDPDIDTGGT